MLGEEATVVCPHSVAERGIIWFEINLMTFFSSV